MIAGGPNHWESTRRAKRRALAIGAAVVLAMTLGALLPVAVLAVTYGAYDAACNASRSC